MTPNDVLFIRFYGEPTQAPSLKPSVLAEAVTHMEAIIRACLGDRVKAFDQTSLIIIASPRSGCIEILLQLDVTFSASSFDYTYFGTLEGQARERLAEARDWAAFFLALVFGGRGVADLFYNGRRATDFPPPVHGVEHLAISLAPAMLKEYHVLRTLKELTKVGARSGFRRIEIQFRDQANISVFDTTSEVRRTFGGLYFAQNGKMLELPNERITALVPSHRIEPLTVVAGGSKLQAFVADYIDEESDAREIILVAWASKRPIPSPGERISVVGRPLSVTDVEVVEPVADFHEKVGAVFLAEKQIIAE